MIALISDRAQNPNSFKSSLKILDYEYEHRLVKPTWHDILLITPII